MIDLAILVGGLRHNCTKTELELLAELLAERARADALVAALPRCAWEGLEHVSTLPGLDWKVCPETSTVQVDVGVGDDWDETRYYCAAHVPDHGTHKCPAPWAEAFEAYRAARRATGESP